MDFLGRCHLLGHYTDKNEERGIQLLHQAAAQKHLPAIYFLARLYNVGRGVDKDTTLAFKLFSIAANEGHAASQAWLGRFYMEGDVTPKDEVRALECWTLAADQGNRDVLELWGAWQLSDLKRPPMRPHKETKKRSRSSSITSMCDSPIQSLLCATNNFAVS
jgi:TPR repeat protein